jgi:hypothetical protein
VNLHEIGDRERPAYCYNLAEAVRVAQWRECKIWTKMDGETNILYEVWPGGRNVRWTLDQLYARENRAATKPARGGK